MRVSARWVGSLALCGGALVLTPVTIADEVARPVRGGVWRWQQPPAPAGAANGKEVNQGDPEAARRLRERARLRDAAEAAAAAGDPGALEVAAATLAQTGTERILVVLVEFAGTDTITFWPGSHWDPVGSGAVGDIVFGPDGPMVGDCSNIIADSGVFTYSGPLHNQIERPQGASATGWNVIWTPDFNPQYYRNVLFGNGFTFDYARQDGSPVHESFAGKSLASYYTDLSGGAYTIAGEVVGWLQVPHSVWWYGADECPGRISLYASNYVASNGAIPGAGSAGTLVTDALDAVKAANPSFNWAQYDGNGDGVIDHLWIIFAGLGEEAGAALLARTTYGEGTIWSHVGSLDTPYEVVPGVKASRYVMLPENSGIGAFAQHFAYDLGGALGGGPSGGAGGGPSGGGSAGGVGTDLGASEGGTPSTGFWTPLSNPNVGYPTRFLSQALDPATLDDLGWLDPKVITDGSTPQTVKIGQTSAFPGGTGVYRGVKIRLPDSQTPLPVQPNATWQWWSGRENLLNATMTTRDQIAVPASGGSLTFKLAYDTEARQDFLWVQASSDGGATWAYLTNADTTCVHNRLWIGWQNDVPYDLCGAGLGGFSGRSAGWPGWTTETFSLSRFAGKSILLRFWYMSDWTIVGEGAFVDDVRVSSGAAMLLADDAEAGDGTWVYADGWDRFSSVRRYAQTYYLQWRNTSSTGGYDAVLGSPYTPCGPLNSGLLVWFQNQRYPDNEVSRYRHDDPSFGPKGRLLVVDAHPEPYRRADWVSQGYDNEAADVWAPCQTVDATFSRHATPGFTFASAPYASRPGVSLFDDGLTWYPGAEHVSLGPNYDPEVFVWATRQWDASLVLPATKPYGIKGPGYQASDPFHYWCVLYSDGKVRCGPGGADETLGYAGGTGNPADAGAAYGWHVEILSETDKQAELKIWNTNADCRLVCDALVPEASVKGVPLTFDGSATASRCSGTIAWDWDAGDGSPHEASAKPTHTYTRLGAFSWSMSARVGIVDCTRSGRVAVVDGPEATVLSGTTPVPDGASTAISFGTIPQGGSRPTKTFTVRNDGTLPLSLGAVSVPSGFTLTEPLAAALAPGASDTFTVRLDNAATGTKKGRVQFATSDPDESPYDFAVTGAVTAPAARKFDFGTASSPVAAGYAGVTPATKFTPSLGYGWLSGTIDARDRARGDDLVRDFDFTPLGTFVVNLANGTYDVTATLGDAAGAHEQMGISLEGTLVDTVSAAVNQFVTRTWRVAVADGQLTVLLDDLGGADPNVVINALTVTPAAPTKYDFGTTASPVESGYTRVAETTRYGAATGYGWLSGTIASRDRATGTSLTRDFNYTALGTFAVDLPNGAWEVTLTMGDATAAHDRMGVYLEGVQADIVTAAKNQFVTRSYRVTVADSQLTLLLDDLGGSDASVVVNALTIAAPHAWLYDFGTATSPVAAGYTRVAESTKYGAAAGYGWLSGTIASRDRGTGGDLKRDFAFTPVGTFAVDVPRGALDVTVVMGDATGAHEQMGVYLEGTLVDTVTTARNQFFTRTYRVTVGEGQLTVLLDDLGGADANAVINALEVR